MLVKEKFPKLSIVVPSYNQGQYLEETLLSIITQDYPYVELIVIDGGSVDNSVSIIKKYENKISYWVSEKDCGQAHAINKGLEKATGEFVAFMNSDDIYYPHAFKEIFSTNAKFADFVHGPVKMGENPQNAVGLGIKQPKYFKATRLLKFFYKMNYIIPSQSVFIRKTFLEQMDLKKLNESLHYCLDMEWYYRIIKAGANIFQYYKPLAFFRCNNTTKTGSQQLKVEHEAIQILYSKLPELDIKEQKNLLKILFLHRILKKIWVGKLIFTRKNIITLAIRLPLLAWKDTRFLGIIKKTLKK